MPIFRQQVTCPFDPYHYMPKNRLQLHIGDCRMVRPACACHALTQALGPDVPRLWIRILQRHDMGKYRTCPFNALHVPKKEDYDAHVAACPDKVCCRSSMLNALAPTPVSPSLPVLSLADVRSAPLLFVTRKRS